MRLRGRWLGAAAGLLLLSAAWWLLSRAPADDPPAAAAAAAAAVNSAPAHAAAVASQPTRAPAIDFAALRAAALKPGEQEVCGFGSAASGSAAYGALVDRMNDEGTRLLTPHLQRMRAHSDPTVRAAALMVMREHAALVQMALASTDPTVVAMAHHACLHPDARNATACGRLALSRWAQLDPDNALPWLELARDAETKGDAQGTAAAYQRAALASQVQAREWSFFDRAWSAVPADMPARDRFALSVALVGVQAALSQRPMFPLLRWCALSRSDATRQPICGELAQLMVVRGGLGMDFVVGRQLGEQAGWPPALIEQLRALGWAYANVLFEDVQAAPRGDLGCVAMQSAMRYQLGSSRLGELQAQRAAVARQGLSDEELLARWRRTPFARASSAPREPQSATSAPR